MTRLPTYEFYPPIPPRRKRQPHGLPDRLVRHPNRRREQANARRKYLFGGLAAKTAGPSLYLWTGLCASFFWWQATGQKL